MVEFLTSHTGVLILGGVVTILIAIAGKYLTVKKMEDLGYKAGCASTSIGSAKLGGTWNKLENWFQELGVAFMTGFNRGLDSDDK